MSFYGFLNLGRACRSKIISNDNIRTCAKNRFQGQEQVITSHSTCGMLFVGLRPVIQILCHVLARGWGRCLRYFTEAKAEVKYRASARIRGPKHDTRFEWPVSILIMTQYPFLPFKTHKTSAKNLRLLTITGAIWFCRYRQYTPSQLWMHTPVAKECRLMTSQYHIFDRTDNLNPQWMQAVNGYLCELLGRPLCKIDWLHNDQKWK